MNRICLPARRIAQPLLRRSQRRHESSTGRHPEPVNESLGRGFYLTLAFFPLSFALYKYSQPSTPTASAPWLTRMIQKFDHWRAEDERRNTMHTAMTEQAAHDRHLFQGMAEEQRKKGRVVELRFPEIFNTGSPYNVPAGSQANLDELMAHYRKESIDAQEKRERKARAIYEGRESEESRFPSEGP